ncbi:MAG TPA: hypothetical protein VG052_16820 [Puia sp.]|nr:hypothetical protein [Puia sp.]
MQGRTEDGFAVVTGAGKRVIGGGGGFTGGFGAGRRIPGTGIGGAGRREEVAGKSIGGCGRWMGRGERNRTTFVFGKTGAG